MRILFPLSPWERGQGVRERGRDDPHRHRRPRHRPRRPRHSRLPVAAPLRRALPSRPQRPHWPQPTPRLAALSGRPAGRRRACPGRLPPTPIPPSPTAPSPNTQSPTTPHPARSLATPHPDLTPTRLHENGRPPVTCAFSASTTQLAARGITIALRDLPGRDRTRHERDIHDLARFTSGARMPTKHPRERSSKYLVNCEAFEITRECAERERNPVQLVSRVLHVLLIEGPGDVGKSLRNLVHSAHKIGSQERDQRHDLTSPSCEACAEGTSVHRPPSPIAGPVHPPRAHRAGWKGSPTPDPLPLHARPCTPAP